MRKEYTIFNGEQLAQARPANTSTATLLNPIDNNLYIVYTIMIANVTGTAANASVFHDKDGTTYDQSTALLYQVSVPGNDTTILTFEKGITVRGDGHIGIQSGTSSSLTYTLYGIKLGEQG
jgi:hypothetical protein